MAVAVVAACTCKPLSIAVSMAQVRQNERPNLQSPLDRPQTQFGMK